MPSGEKAIPSSMSANLIDNGKEACCDTVRVVKAISNSGQVPSVGVEPVDLRGETGERAEILDVACSLSISFVLV